MVSIKNLSNESIYILQIFKNKIIHERGCRATTRFLFQWTYRV